MKAIKSGVLVAIVVLSLGESRGAVYVVDEGQTFVVSENLSGPEGVTKQGGGTLVLSGHNLFTGSVVVEAGVLELDGSNGGAASLTAALTVGSGATLLVSQSHQVDDDAGVTLAGGTISLGSATSETFGDLSLTSVSFLDFGAGGASVMRFNDYEPEFLLVVNQFLPGDKLQFSSGFPAFSVDNPALFSFSGEFTTGIEDGSFTITAVPEPSTWLLMATGIGLVCRRRSRPEKIGTGAIFAAKTAPVPIFI